MLKQRVNHVSAFTFRSIAIKAKKKKKKEFHEYIVSYIYSSSARLLSMKSRKAENINCNSYLSTIQLVVSHTGQQFHHFLPNNHGNEMRLMRKAQQTAWPTRSNNPSILAGGCKHRAKFSACSIFFFFKMINHLRRLPWSPAWRIKMKKKMALIWDLWPRVLITPSCPHPTHHHQHHRQQSGIDYRFLILLLSIWFLCHPWWNNLLMHILPSREGWPNLCKGTETSPRATSFSLRGASC